MSFDEATEACDGVPGLRGLTREQLLQNASGTSTVHAVAALDQTIGMIRASSLTRDGRLVDLGCGYAWVSTYLAGQCGIREVYGVDRSPKRLAGAAAQGVRTIQADLETGLPLPLDDGSAAIVTSFGALEHLRWYDTVLEEARRLLIPGGWLLLSLPNLGSYVNRVALLLGYQPRDVEVSERSAPGVLPIYRVDRKARHLGHVHSATLRCMQQLLDREGFTLVQQHGYAPGGPRLFDRVFGRFPTLSRRFILLARLRGPVASAHR